MLLECFPARTEIGLITGSIYIWTPFTSTFACICCSRNELVKERTPFSGHFEKKIFKKKMRNE